MEIETIWIDVTANLISGNMPIYLIERPLPASAQGNPHGGSFVTAEVAREGRFWVPQLDLMREPPMWVLTQAGQWVRVPVHGYRTNQRSLATIFGLGLEIGARAVGSLARAHGEHVKKLCLVLGSDCTDLAVEGADAMRCYAGVALIT